MSKPSSERFLVTGARGCIGAAAVRRLLDEGVDVVAADVGSSDHRLQYVLDAGELGQLEQVSLDITDREAVRRLVLDGGFTNLIHLAAVQVPFCRADPVQGALINVVGTVNLMQSFLDAGSFSGPFVYASSIAAYDADDDAQGDPQSPPKTMYGVYKVATENAAAVLGDDEGMPSIGLRPAVVYGVGRDQGMTSSPTAAMLAAAAGRGAELSYSGASQHQFVEDVARAFVSAARSRATGSHVFNLGGRSTDMSEIVEAIEAAAPEVAGQIEICGNPLPFPADAGDDGLSDIVGPLSETPLAAGIEKTIHSFRQLLANGLIELPS